MHHHPKFEHSRFLGDKRTQLVYDLDAWDDDGIGRRDRRRPGRPELRSRHARRGPQPWVLAGDAGPVAGCTASRAPDRAVGCHAGDGRPFTSSGLSSPATSPGRPATSNPGPGVILCHGFPIGPLDARRSGGTFPQLIDRIAYELGYVAMTFNFRGCGTSEGDFSLQGWVDDLRNAIVHLLTMQRAERRDLRRDEHGRLDRHLRRAPTTLGCLRRRCSARGPTSTTGPSIRAGSSSTPGRSVRSTTVGFPPSIDEWSREFRRFRPVASARRFAPRPMLVMHGEDDDSVPASDARQLVKAHGSAELSLFAGAGHRLRHDPRAVAVLLGWLDRMRSTHGTSGGRDRLNGREPSAVVVRVSAGARRHPCRGRDLRGGLPPE